MFDIANTIERLFSNHPAGCWINANELKASVFRSHQDAGVTLNEVHVAFHDWLRANPSRTKLIYDRTVIRVVYPINFFPTDKV
jgi:hypothetical protein